jgi:hypothetical protein
MKSIIISTTTTTTTTTATSTTITSFIENFSRITRQKRNNIKNDGSIESRGVLYYIE